MDNLVKTYNILELSKFMERIVSLSNEKILIIKKNLDNRYYNTGEDVIEDTRYDLLIEELGRRGQKLEVGCKLREGDNSCDLPFYIGGMDKLKCGDDKKIERWLSKNICKEFVVSNKLNGVSCLACFDDKGNVKLYTRGDGKTGADISYLSKNIQGLPKKTIWINNFKDGVNVRGELIITEKDYQSNPDKKKNCLSTIIGLVNSKTLRESVNQLHFVAFDLFDMKNRSSSPSCSFGDLKAMGFEVAPFELVKSEGINSKYLSSLLEKRKKSSIYDIDGLIIQGDVLFNRKDIGASGNPKYAIAFKANIEIANVEVIDVVWEISRYGIIKPQVKIVPTEICNITNVSLSGFNAKFIKDNKIGKGSIITITRSGDIIPYIMGIVKRSNNGEPLFPTYKYTWNESGVDILIDKEEQNDSRDIAQIVHFFKTMEVKHISEGIIKKLYDNGYTSIELLLKCDVKKLTTIDGIGESVVKRLSQVYTALKNVKISTIIVASGEFEGFGNKRIETICEKYNPLVDKINVSDLTKLDGISTMMSEKFVGNLPNFIVFYNKIKSFVHFVNKKEVSIGKYTSFIFVFSGFRANKELEETIKSKGGEIAPNLTKATTHLVLKDKSSTSSKVIKAQELGVKIISMDWFD